MLLFFLFVNLLNFCLSTFTPDFQDYLKTNYGQDFLVKMSREDLGKGYVGSFGGKQNADDILVNQPIIFVHGVMLRAGIFMSHLEYFEKFDYKIDELYGTSYGDGITTPIYIKEMTCEDVKQIRNFIKVVNEYTGSKVDIIAYSMGVAITRKAILGGRCVDTLEDLGNPLTDLIDTFVGVAGLGYGMENCSPMMRGCNHINGMLCTSDFMQDVNSKTEKYEGSYSFTIFTVHDMIVGQNCCGHQCSEVKFSDGISKQAWMGHETIIMNTKDIQLRMIRNHTL